jgi:hypothetical protein
MKLATEAVSEGQPLPITFKAYVTSKQPDWQASVFVNTSLAFDDDSPVFNAHKLKLVIKALLPSSDLEKISVAMITEGEINVQAQTAKLSNARLSVLGLTMTGDLDIDNIFSVPVIHGPLKVKKFEAQSLAERFKITIPKMGNAESLRSVSLSTLFRTDFDMIRLDKIVAKIDGSSASGFVHILNFQQPTVSYGLKLDHINTSDYMAISEEPDQGELLLPLDLIRTSSIEGKLDVDKVMVSGNVELSNFHITSSIKDGVLSAEPVRMLIGESKVDARINFDARNTPEGLVTANVEDVDATDSINPTLKAIMGDDSLVFEGMVDVAADIHVAGVSMQELKKSAKGTVKISMEEPLVVQGIDLDYASRTVVADYANKNNFRTRKSFVPEFRPERKTKFNSMSGLFKIGNGKWTNDDLLLSSEEANISGSGSIDFINKKLDYRPVIDINVNNRVDIRDKLRDHPMEYHAYGVFEDLSYKFEVDKYELLVGRLLLQEAKARSIKQKNENTWDKYKSR